jgi:spermidine/putrescine transport system substrate-binding protein
MTNKISTSERQTAGSYPRRAFLARAASSAVALSTAGTLLSACGSSKSSSSGKVGGSLSMLAWDGYRGKGVSDTWLSQNHVSVKEGLLTANEEILTKLMGGGIGKLSLTTPDAAYVPQLVAADVLEPIDLSRLPNLEHLIPVIDKTARKSNEFNGKLYAIPYLWGFDGMIYNTKLVKSAPKSWNDVLDPKFKGKVLMLTGAFPNFEIWPRMLGYNKQTLTKAQLEHVTNFLIELKNKHVRIVTGDQSQMASLLSSGECLVTGSGCWVGLPSLAPEGGDEIAFTMPPEGGGSTWIDCWAIPKNAPNIDTVYAYLNEMMSPTVQAKQADLLGMGTSNALAAKQVSKANQTRYDYSNAQVGSELAPLFQFPEEGKGYTTSEEWNEAWNKVQAA